MRVAPLGEERRTAMDLVYVGLTFGFFALSLALVELFDRL
jgi:hypothetical protein